MKNKINGIVILALMVTAGCSSRSAVTAPETSGSQAPSPKISSQRSFKFACSFSSIEIKITPSLLNKSLANKRRGYINAS